MKQPFPVDIQEYAIRARQHLEATRLLNGPVGISSIAIHHKTVATEGKLEDGGAALEERWYMFFFNSRLPNGDYVPGQELTVVMLLDGAFAEPRLLKGQLAYPFRPSGTIPRDP